MVEPALAASATTRALRVVAVLLFAAAPLCGQLPAGAGASSVVRVIPRLGVLSPDAYLYEQYVNFSGDGPVEWTNAYLGRAPVLGVGIEVGRPAAGVYLRGEVLRSFRGWLYAAHSVVVPRQLYDPPYVETSWLDIPAAVTVLSVQVVLPTRLILWRSEPYVLAGVSGKRYEFGEPAGADPVDAILPEEGLTWGAEAGAGFTVRLMGYLFDLQARDAINRYWGKTEHDLVFSAGLIWRVR